MQHFQNFTVNHAYMFTDAIFRQFIINAHHHDRQNRFSSFNHIHINSLKHAKNFKETMKLIFHKNSSLCTCY